MLFAIWHVSPSPEMTFAIFAYAGLVLLVVSIIAVLWIKCVMRKPLFKPEPLASVLGTSTDKKPQGDSQ
ncbi:hypothetical protein D3C84_912790 [compost metagenome]